MLYELLVFFVALAYDVEMKKIKVSALAKKKNIPTAEAVKLLKKKGLAKVTSTTYVSPDALDTAPSEEKKDTAVISHIFPPVGTSGSLATQAMRISELKKEVVTSKAEDKKQKPKSKEKKAVAKEPVQAKAENPPVKGGAKLRTDIVAAIAALIAILLLGLMYVGQRADRAIMKDLGASLTDIKQTVANLEKGVGDNSAAIAGVNEKIKATELAMLSLEIRSQGAVLKSLSGNLKESLRGRTQTLADGLSSF